jgi:hypothetical protein
MSGASASVMGRKIRRAPVRIGFSSMVSSLFLSKVTVTLVFQSKWLSPAALFIMITAVSCTIATVGSNIKVAIGSRSNKLCLERKLNQAQSG